MITNKHLFLIGQSLIIYFLMWKLFTFSPYQHSIEHKMISKAESSLTNSQTALITGLKKHIINSKIATATRFDDRGIVEEMEKMTAYTLAAIEKVKNSEEEEIQSIVEHWQAEHIDSIELLKKLTPIISSNELEQLSTNLKALFDAPLIEISKELTINRLLAGNIALNNYLSSKIGMRSTRCCFGRFKPTIANLSPLSLGETSEIEVLFIEYCKKSVLQFREIRVNGERLMVKNGQSALKHLVTKKGKQDFEVEILLTEEMVRNDTYVTDS